MSRHELAGNILKTLPSFFKALIKDLDWSSCEVTVQQFHLLHFVDVENGKSMSHYSEQMGIPKPNVTVIADKLSEEGLIERALDPKDRRVVILKISQEGKKCIERTARKMKNEIVSKLEKLDDSEVERLNEIFIEIKNMISKIK